MNVMSARAHEGGSRRRWTGWIMSVVVAALLVGLSSAAPASAVGLPPINGGQPIYGYESLCLDDPGGNLANYTQLRLDACFALASEQWHWDPRSAIIQLEQDSQKCMDVYAGGTTDGTPVDLYDCNSTGAQQWVQRPGGSLYNPQSGKCLDDTAWGGSGTALEIWDCNGGANQDWSAI